MLSSDSSKRPDIGSRNFFSDAKSRSILRKDSPESPECIFHARWATTEPDTPTLSDQSDENYQRHEELRVEMDSGTGGFDKDAILTLMSNIEAKLAALEISVSKANSVPATTTQVDPASVSLAQDKPFPISRYANSWMEWNFKEFRKLPQLIGDYKKWRKTFDDFFRKYEILEKIIRFDLKFDEINLTTKLRYKFCLSKIDDGEFQDFLSFIISGLNTTLINVSGADISKVPDDTLQTVVREIYENYDYYYFDKVSTHVNEYMVFNNWDAKPPTDVGTDVQLFFCTRDYTDFRMCCSHISVCNDAFNHLLKLIADEFKKYSKGEEYKSLREVMAAFKLTDHYRRCENNKYDWLTFNKLFHQKYNKQLIDAAKSKSLNNSKKKSNSNQKSRRRKPYQLNNP